VPPVEPAGAPPESPAPALSWTLLLVAVGVLAWARVFTTWFAQDDFRWLLRAAEHGSGPLGTPRLLSMSLYFRALYALAGVRPAAYHAVGVALHVATGLLFFRVLARRLPAAASAAAAAVFLTSPALFDALHWVSAIAELMCGAFLALAVWLLLGRTPGSWVQPWLAVVAYALALLSKEVAVGAAPALALLQWRCGGGGRGARALLTLALASLVAVGASGAWQTGTGEPYALSPRAALLNTPAFVAAATTAGAAWRSASDLVWGRSALVQVLGWSVLAVWLAALVARRSAPAWWSFAWFLALLAPVLALERQFYFYYLYAALPGLVASAAFLLVAPTRPPAAGPGGRRWPPAGAVVVVLVVAQAVALEARATSWLAATPLPADFVLRRAFIARNAIADLDRQRQRLGPQVVLLGQQPIEASWQGASTTAPTAFARDPWWDENVRAALSGGEALRLLFPIVREVVFKPWLEPADTDRTIVPYRVDGHLEVTDYASFVGVPDLAAPATLAEHLERAGRFLTRRLFREALRELLAARALAPDHPDVLVNLGALQANLGDSSGALATLAHATAVTPGDVDALFDLGLIQWRLGRQAEARATWERLLARAPGSDLARRVRELQAGQAN
jgi:hypothetical protein